MKTSLLGARGVVPIEQEAARSVRESCRRTRGAKDPGLFRRLIQYGGDGDQNKAPFFEPFGPERDSLDADGIKEGRAHGTAMRARGIFQIGEMLVDFQRGLDAVQRLVCLEE